GAVLMAMLLLSMAFVPAVSAKAVNEKIEKDIEKQVEKLLKDTAPDDAKIDWIIDENNRKEYYVTVSKDGTEQDFFVKQWTEEIAGKQVWKFNLFEIEPDGVIASSVSFGKDSYYWFDTSGIHMHFGPKDKALILTLGLEAVALIVAVLVAAAVYYPPLVLSAALAGVFAAALAIVITVVDYLESNADDSIDVFISWTNTLLIPIYAVLPGTQNISVKIGSHYYNVGI
ncbi:MAG: hypothetical protein SCH70_13555, partial [Candidatus Methanoperedens sp.]|nr:hypothetical protein [Candidatus Methanoperedens sp.]